MADPLSNNEKSLFFHEADPFVEKSKNLVVLQRADEANLCASICVFLFRCGSRIEKFSPHSRGV